MKKIISLCLVVVMLLGMVAMTASAEGEGPTYDGYYVSLGEDIILNFSFANLDANTAYTATINGEEAEVIVDGTTGVVQVTSLTPGDINIYYTVALLADGETVATSAEKSVKDYCMWALTNMDLSNDVHNLVVDLLNYAAASQKYMGAAVTANADLSDLQKALASVAPTDLDEYLLSGNNGGQITWTFAQPVLGESVAYRFGYSVSEYYLNDYSFRITMGDETFVVNETYWTAKDGAYIEFIHLNPADLCTDVVVVAVDENGNPLSSEWTFSAERYASYAKSISEDSDDYNPNLVPLMDTILAYSKGAANYNAVGETNAEHLRANQPLRNIRASALTAHEQYVVSRLTPADYTSVNGTSIQLSYLLPWFCQKVGINLAHPDYKSLTYAGVNSALNSSTTAGHYFYNTMLVENTTGKGEGVSIAEENLQIGDIFVGWYFKVKIGSSNKSDYYGAVWLGDKFLVVHDNWSADGNNPTVEYMSYDELNAINFSSARYVLRPCQLVLRDMADGALTEAEENILANLTGSDIPTNNTTHLTGTMPLIYENAGILLENHDKTAHGAFTTVFQINETGKYEPKAPSEDEVTKYYQTMLTDFYGGDKFSESIKLSEAQLEIGDLFVARMIANGNKYWSGVYQGSKNFLMIYTDGDGTLHKEVVSVTTLEESTFDYYFVLRPNNLANQAN